jgi:hypothetical protein
MLSWLRDGRWPIDDDDVLMDFEKNMEDVSMVTNTRLSVHQKALSF